MNKFEIRLQFSIPANSDAQARALELMRQVEAKCINFFTEARLHDASVETPELWEGDKQIYG